MNPKTWLYGLIGLEESLEDALDILTAIGITTSNDELFKLTEEVRNELVCEEKVQEKWQNNLRGNKQSSDNNSVLIHGAYEVL